MIKYASNAFLATKITFINEIANVCEETGADREVARGDGPRPADRAAFPPRGHRLRRLVLPEGRRRAQAARRELGLPLPAPERGDRGERAAEAARGREARQKHLGALRGKTVALLGLAFKPDTNDMREAASLVLAARLLAEGPTCGAGTRWPSTRREAVDGVELCESLGDALADADAAVIVTEWPELEPPFAREFAPRCEPADRRRAQHSRSRRRRAAGFAYEASAARARSPGDPEQGGARRRAQVMEALILAGGKAERLGDAARGRPKPLVEVGGRALAAHQVVRLAAAGVDRVVVACARGQEEASP